MHPQDNLYLQIFKQLLHLFMCTELLMCFVQLNLKPTSQLEQTNITYITVNPDFRYSI